MRSFLIEVCRVFSDHPLYMPAILEENLIQTFSSQTTHKPFTDPIGLWRSIGRLEFLDP